MFDGGSVEFGLPWMLATGACGSGFGGVGSGGVGVGFGVGGAGVGVGGVTLASKCRSSISFLLMTGGLVRGRGCTGASPRYIITSACGRPCLLRSMTLGLN